jgi:protein-L-isoaspartate(D-aspartate) O-methyltransferase
VIFAFNRLGLSYAEQSTLAMLAAEAVMGEPGDGAPRPAAGAVPARVGGMDTETTGTTAESLRHALVGQLLERGIVRIGPVEHALRAVPRHLFVPAVPVQQAYADEPVYTKHDAAGTSISAASQPAIVAIMLEQLQARPGQRILEIGAGTGYNAALLAHLAGEHGQVTTVDVDQDLTDSARSALARAGYANVRVILGDGALGHAASAPYDRIIATVGTWDLPPAWLAQLAPAGRVVVPLRLRGSITRSVALERDGSCWRAVSSEMCGFMPLRASIAGDPRRIIPLTDDGSVTLQAHQDQDVNPGALAGVLTRPRSQEWTGVTFGTRESAEWMDLWLACTMGNAVSRMPVQRQAVDTGLVTPMFRWGAMATAEDDTLAYLTFRPAPPARDGAARNEVGITAHGSRSADLAAKVAAQIRTWDRDYRTRTPRILIHPASVPGPLTGQFTFATPNNRLVISWE